MDVNASSLLRSIQTLVKHSMLDQADPNGKPSHGREYDINNQMKLLSNGEFDVLSVIMNSEFPDETKSNIFMTYADGIKMRKSGIPDIADDLEDFVRSLKSDGILPAMPIWCLPDYIPLIDTRQAAETHYINRRKALISLGKLNDSTHSFYDFLENFNKYLYTDSECICQLVSGGRNRMRVKKEFGAGKVGRAMLIKDQMDNDYIMKVMGKVKATPLTLSVHNSNERNPITKAIQVPASASASASKFMTVGGTDFTNQTIMHMLLNLLLGKSKNYVYQYDAFYCNNTGANIMDIASEGDMFDYLNTLKTPREKLDACSECLKQLLPVLVYLKHPDIGFTHNDLKLKNVFVHRDPETQKIYYQLADFDKSSMSWRNIRFYNNTRHFEIGMDPASSVKHNGTKAALLDCGIIGSLCKNNTDIIGKSIGMFTMYNPSGYYLGYDIYTLVASMLFHPDVYKAYKDSMPEGSMLHNVVASLTKPTRNANFITTIDKYMATDKDRKTTGEQLQRITMINGIMHKNEIAVRNDLNAILSEVGIDRFVPDPISGEFRELAGDKTVKPIISKNGHLCLSKPKNKQCRTPPYTSWMRTYDYDEAKVGKIDYL